MQSVWESSHISTISTTVPSPTSSSGATLSSTAPSLRLLIFPSCCILLSPSNLQRAGKHVFLFTKSVVALVSAILCWLGVWELLDLYLLPRSITRDVLYVLISAVVMCLCGTYLPNCGVWPHERRMNVLTSEAIDLAQPSPIFVEDMEELENERREKERRANGGEVQQGNETANNNTHAHHPGLHDGALVGLTNEAENDRESRIKLPKPPPTMADIDALHAPVTALSDAHIPLTSPIADSGAASSDCSDTSTRVVSYWRALAFLICDLCNWHVVLDVYVASLLSLLASICFWTGSYNLILALSLFLCDQDETAAYVLNTIIGWILMWLTGTLYDQAGLLDEERESSIGSSTSAFISLRLILPLVVRLYIRATIAIVGSMCFWLGETMLVEQLSTIYYERTHDHPPTSDISRQCQECIDSTPTRNAIFIILGLLIFKLTDTMAIHAGIEQSINHAPNDQTNVNYATSNSDLELGSITSSSSARHACWPHCFIHPVMRHVRAFISLTGVILLWAGIWDAAFTGESEHEGWGIMVVFSLVGLLGLMLTNSLFSNSGVVPPFGVARKGAAVQQRLSYIMEEAKDGRMERMDATQAVRLEHAAVVAAMHHQQLEMDGEVGARTTTSTPSLIALSPLAPLARSTPPPPTSPSGAHHSTSSDGGSGSGSGSPIPFQQMPE